MARSEARLHLAIWSDHDYTALSLEAQWLYEFLISQPQLTWAGVVPLTLKRWSRHARGATVVRLRKALAELARHRYVVIDEATEEVFVRSFLRHDRVLRQPLVAIAAVSAYRDIASPLIRASWLVEFHRYVSSDDAVIAQKDNGRTKGAVATSEKLLELYRTEPLPEGFPKGFPKGLYQDLPEEFWKGFPEPSPNGLG